MAISQYWVGQIPARPLSITVSDDLGRPIDLSSYTGFKVRLIDPTNADVDTTGAILQTGGARTGRFVFVWPTDKTLFTRTGDYLLQLELSGPGQRDFTTAHTIRVRDLGRIN